MAESTNLPLRKKIALVTGGGGGIGTGICHALAGAGATVILTYNRNAEAAQLVADELPGDGHAVFQASVDNSDSMRALTAQITERFRRLDVLVNNAGMTKFIPHGDLDALDDELIDSIFRVNWRGAFACVRAFQALLTDGDGGLVVNISSTAGLSGIGSNVAYCASKAAMDSMTRSLARSLAPAIRVNSVAPGLVEGDYARSFDPAWRQHQIDGTPSGRLSTPDDVGQAVLALATLLPQTTGAVLTVEGGRLLN